MYKPQPIHPKQNRNQMKYGSNKLCMPQTGKKKSTRTVKKNKINFVKVSGDKFTMNIRWGKLTVHFVRSSSVA